MADEHTKYAEQMLDAVNDAAAAVSTRFVTFVSVGAYVAVTVAATTHEMLLRATNLVTLPLLNAQIPIIGPFGFYTIAPWLIVLLHSDLLLQLSILATELKRFEGEVEKTPEQERGFLRQRVANFYYVLYFTGQAPSRLLHLLSAFITWVTAVAIPLGLLLWIQVRFLPYHSVTDTWFHRGAVFTDAALILFILLPRITPLLKKKERVPGWQAPIRQAFSVRSLVFLGCALTMAFSLFVATIPDEDTPGRAWFAQNMQLRERVLTTNLLSPEDVNALRDYDDPERLQTVLVKVTPFQALQGRDFRFADLYNAVLPKLDLRAVRDTPSEGDAVIPADCVSRRGCEDPPECEEATLHRTQLTGANFEWASMQQAMFDGAVLEGANLAWTKIQSGSFQGARMNLASLTSAKLQNVRFDDAKLCGADLSGANLTRAVLARAFLQGANLRGAKMAKANLDSADLRGADLSDADLTEASLRGAALQGAILPGAATPAAESGDLHGFLVGLACASPAAAHGITFQALHSPSRNRQALSRALLDAIGRGDCAALSSLTPELRAELEQVAASKPAAAK